MRWPCALAGGPARPPAEPGGAAAFDWRGEHDTRGLDYALLVLLTKSKDAGAVKWSPAGAPIEVTVKDGTVTVRDHGRGIDTADLPHIFDRLYRAAAARTLPGSGLGLAIVRQVAEAHGGSATVGPAPGGGAVFTLRLPVTTSNAAHLRLADPDATMTVTA